LASIFARIRPTWVITVDSDEPLGDLAVGPAPAEGRAAVVLDGVAGEVHQLLFQGQRQGSELEQGDPGPRTDPTSSRPVTARSSSKWCAEAGCDPGRVPGAVTARSPAGDSAAERLRDTLGRPPDLVEDLRAARVAFDAAFLTLAAGPVLAMLVILPVRDNARRRNGVHTLPQKETGTTSPVA
jgi:hypothetical protein